MPSERVQRRVDELLEQADQAMEVGDWEAVRLRCEAVLAFDPENTDARDYLTAAERGAGHALPARTAPAEPPTPPLPSSFVAGRYQVLGLLGEGGRKVVYRAHDTRLDRDVAFALLKTGGLDAGERERVRREARTLGRLSSHPHIVTVYEVGDDDGTPYIVSELMEGGDLSRLIAETPDHRLPLDRVLAIGRAIAEALVFAHAKGIVHRDLKPGNIWLSASGVAKLGDFGLAIADHDPRLTQAGLVVGTALYMAPEQATGSEVTRRSDLYSLGCVLYELVTGRPPFVGDASVAIIGQHLHANPVAPSWSRPNCPPTLETLILRLLEKDPGRRPGTAQAVLETLNALSTGPAPAQGSSTPLATAIVTANPIYRSAFVGREQELRQLQAAFDAAQAGQGGLVMVMGEPGIGKTTLIEQLSTHAALRGGRALVGHCYEEGSLSLPYLPFVEALRSYVLDREPGRLRSELGSGAPDVARIVSEVRDRVQVAPSTPSGDAGEDRYRLLNAVASFLRNAAAVQPLVVVLEDLHDADRGTLDLLTFLARNLSGARLLVVGTFRDVEVDRAHPLSATLAELRRGTNFGRVALRGLSADEVQRMLSAVAGQDVQRALAEAVHRQTEGNPLFVQEVVRYLAEAGLITREGGRWRATAGAPLLQSIPEGLRDVIGKRLSRLSEPCNRLLAVAAVIGREFDLQTLQAIAGAPEEGVLAAVEEAVKVAVLQDQRRPGALRYRFAHAFFRQTLYEELFAPRRLRLHQQVARALEQRYAGRLDEHAAELAEHFAQSTDSEDLQKAVAYSERAAARASAVYAHGEGVRLLERALEVQEVLDPRNGLARCDLLLTLGEALLATSEPQRVVSQVAEQAHTLAEAAGDEQRAARAGGLAIMALWALTAGSGIGTAEYDRWVQRIDRHAAPGTVERVVADVARASQIWIQGRYAETRELYERALQLAAQLGASDVALIAAFMALNPLSQDDVAWRCQTAQTFLNAPRHGVRAQTLACFLQGAAPLFLMHGDRTRAEAALAELRALPERLREPALRIYVLAVEAYLATVDGELERSVALGEEIAKQGDAVGTPVVGAIWRRMATHWPHLYRGTAEVLYEPTARDWQRAPLLAHGGRPEEARVLLEEALVTYGIDGNESGLHTWGTLCLLDAAIALEDGEAAAKLSRCLERLADLGTGEQAGACPGRLMGGAAALNGERQRARDYYQRALAAAQTLPFRPEIALIRLELAELLVDGSAEEQTEAREHLAFVTPEFEAMGMAPALARARALTPGPSPAAAGEGSLKGGAGALADPDSPGPSGPTHPSPDRAAPALPSPAGAGEGPGVRAPVFISYSSDDRPRAVALAEKLEAAGLSVWLDRRSIAGGASWDEEIVRGIKASGVVAVLCSAAAMQSPNVQQELRLAMQYRKALLPLLLEPTAYPESVEYILAGRQWVELLDRPEADWLPDVLTALRRLR